jgi:flagellar FliJ protein
MKLRFTAVLTLYQEREERAKAELGRLEMARAPLAQAIETIAAERRAAVAGPVIPALRETLLAYCAAAEVRQRQAQDRLKAHEGLIDKARTALAEAHRARTTIEKLREHDAAEIRRRQDKREQRQLDELATRNHLLTMGG